VHLSRGPRENGHRPAIDPLFRSAANEYAAKVIGVALSGALDDGTAGLVAVKSRGGVAVVQDPADALYPGMPGRALEHVQVDHVVAAASMGKLLARLLADLAEPPPGPAPDGMRVEVEMEEFSPEVFEGEHPGRPSGFSCPDCNGVLWQIREGGLERYRCRVGHAWSPEGLLTQQSEALEAALWVALRSLEERAALARRLYEPARRRGHSITATRFEEQAAEAAQAARLVRELLVNRVNFATGWPLGGRPPPAGGPSLDRGDRWLSRRPTGTWRSCSTTCGAPAGSTSPATSGPACAAGSTSASRTSGPAAT
jgi:two-component system chemotaxis response regulator CheB